MENYYNPKETTLSFLSSVKAKIEIPIGQFSLLAILGGAFIAFGGLLSIMVSGGMPGFGANNPGLVQLIAGALFPVGLIMVSITGADLFTSDCAVFTLATLKREVNYKLFVKYLILSYVFNFVGTQIVAFLLTYQVGFMQTNPWADYFHLYAEKKVHQGFSTVFLKGIGANWLVCLGMFMGYSAKDIIGKCIGIWIPVMLFVTLGYEHSIANLFFIPTAIYTGADIAVYDFILKNLLPSTIGNFIGGAVFVGMAYWYLYLKSEQNV